MAIKYHEDSKNLFLSIIGSTIVAIVTWSISWVAGFFDKRIWAFWIGLIVLIILFFVSLGIYNRSTKKR